jgi:signal transduction histidine kinase
VKLYEALQESYKMLQCLEEQRDSLTHMIVHDLRTPLCSVISGLQTVPVMGELNADQEEMMGIALEGGQTLLGMINGLLDVDKMEAGAMQLDYAALDARELLASATAQVAQLAAANQLTLLQQPEDDLPYFEGDEDVLKRVLVNLLGNAIKFTPAGGTVTTSISRVQGGKFLLFSVSDTGEGIPTEAFARIFEKFGQVESRQSGRLMSTGLGLTFCKLAVEAHGGRIDVDSTAGKGSFFFFTVPLKP